MTILGSGGLGGFMNNLDPARKRYNQIQQLTDPWKIQQQARDLFQNNLSSPGFNMARSETLGAGQAAQGALMRNLGQTGLLHSGVGNAAIGAAAAAPGIHLGQLTANAWEQAQGQASHDAFGRATLLGGMPQQTNNVGNFAAGGMNAFLPYLFKMLQARGGVPGMDRGTPGGYTGGGGTQYNPRGWMN